MKKSRTIQKRQRKSGSLYTVLWFSRGGRYYLTLDKTSGVTVDGKTFDEAEEHLIDFIADEFMDPCPQFSYRPPKPSPHQRLAASTSDFVYVSFGTSTARFVNVSDLLFRGGICEFCRSPIGERSQDMLNIDRVFPDSDGAFVTAERTFGPDGRALQVTFQVVHEKFVTLLRRLKLRRLATREVLVNGRLTQNLFELLDVGSIPCVNCVDFPDDNSWHCAHCGAKTTWTQYVARGQAAYFISESDISGDSDVFTIRTGRGIQLAMRHHLWLNIAGKPGARGLLANPLWVLPETKCEHRPKQSFQSWWRKTSKQMKSIKF